MGIDQGRMRRLAQGIVALVVFSSAALHAQPVITQNPQSENVPPGSLVTLSVAASGTEPLEYRWEHNGRLMRQRGSTLRFIASRRRAGTYGVLVRDALGQIRRSAPATIVVDIPPVIVSQPQSTTVREHETAVFRVRLANVGPGTFMVWHNDNPLEGSHQIPDGLGFDVHQPTLSIPDCNNNDSYNGVYWLAVTNGTAGTISRKVTLTVLPAQ
jgi:hypothetical protein